MDLLELYEKKRFLGNRHKIRLFLKKEEDVYCFVEGKDSEYYFPKIQACTDKKITFFDCRGRDNVILNYSIIEYLKKYVNYKILYFIDRDFNVDVVPDSIYQTPCYAIENLYVHKNVLSAILEYSWHIDEEDRRIALELYENSQKNYHFHALEMNTFIKLQKYLSHDRGLGIKLNLSNINLDDLYKIDLESTERKIGMEQWISKVGETIEYEESQFADIQNTFSKSHYCYEFRGKNELFFMKKYMERLKEELGKKNTE